MKYFLFLEPFLFNSNQGLLSPCLSPYLGNYSMFLFSHMYWRVYDICTHAHT